MTHPEITKFIDEHEREALLKGSYRKKLGRLELTFLEAVWGPAMGYSFAGLKAEYPLKDLKGGQRFADFVFVRNGMRLMIELDGFTTHARDISPTRSDARAEDVWGHRRQLVIQAAVRRCGKLRPADLAAEFGISNRTASLWLKRFAENGTFCMPSKGTRAIQYTLVHHDTD